MATQKTKAGRGRAILMMLLVFGPASLLVLFSMNKCENKFQELGDYGNVGEYEFTTADGKTISNESMKGNIVIFSTIQNTCPVDCAIDMARFNLLIYQKYRKLQRNASHIKFVSILVDEEGNALDDLGAIDFTVKDEIEGYNPDVWMLVKGDPKQIYDITNKDLSLMEANDEKAYKGKPWLETMIIVDKENHVRMLRSGATEGMVRDLNEHISLLEKQYDKAAAKAEEEAE
ncbi:SCO family protein [Lishizhenia sp.]|uniref:SCO family protein n=1 Tax=Lishizhenia sp. TaxID=2497594 RepID=UPI00299D92A5|nr:SCO family protein [Lishizhenia sp.]MDX1444741.1 SCO family protein [Lishizhenia sp.]